jgi:hypothetical protein
LKTKAKTEQKPDIAAQAKRLREQTCQLLGLDISKLTPAQLVRVDRASVLRLRLSDLEALQLNGGAFDAREYVAVSTEYERLLMDDATELSTPEGQARLDAEIEQKFREIIGASRGDSDDPDAAPSETEQLRQRIAELEDENMHLRWGDMPSAEQVASEPAAKTPAASPSENVVPFAPVEQQKYHSTRAVGGKPPQHYLREENSGAWPPYFPLDPYR